MFAHVSLPTILILYVALLFSLSVHEASHATAAYLLDDDTAARMGRMTINPLPHLDPLGTVVFPLLGLLFGGFFIGWAKPVIFNPVRLTRRLQMKVSAALIAMAGPASNLFLAVVFVVVTAVAVRTMAPDPLDRLPLFLLAFEGPQALMDSGMGAGLVLLLGLGSSLVKLNVLLAIFNLLPIGPLDGAGVLGGFLPDRYQYRYNQWRYHRYTAAVLFGLMLLGGLRYILEPALGQASRVVFLIARLVLGV